MFRNAFLSPISVSARSSSGKRFMRIHVKLDYHPSSQYAGIHLAMQKNLYKRIGLDVVLTKPGEHGGDEPKFVVDKQTELENAAELDSISIGIVEQNVLIPAIGNNVPVKAFASIFQMTPLILLGLPGINLGSIGDLKDFKIGMHIDSTELMKTIIFHSDYRSSTVQTVQRADKMDKLLAGTVNAIQVHNFIKCIPSSLLTDDITEKINHVINLLSITFLLTHDC